MRVRANPISRGVPPWCGGSAAPKQRDWTTEEGAHALARTIREAWARCGHDIQPTVEMIRGGHGNTWFVRVPQLINGLPPS